MTKQFQDSPVDVDDPGDQSGLTTRDRILEIAEELFTTQGYDSTSLREIAERLGFSKAAIYYHFASKEDILWALHQQLHDLGKETMDSLDLDHMTVEDWSTVLNRLIAVMMEHRQLFVLHDRNRNAFERLHREGHEEDHNDLEALIRSALKSPEVPLKDRVRMACALGAALFGLVVSADAFSKVPDDELGSLLVDIVDDIMARTGS